MAVYVKRYLDPEWNMAVYVKHGGVCQTTSSSSSNDQLQQLVALWRSREARGNHHALREKLAKAEQEASGQRLKAQQEIKAIREQFRAREEIMPVRENQPKEQQTTIERPPTPLPDFSCSTPTMRETIARRTRFETAADLRLSARCRPLLRSRAAGLGRTWSG